jgi:hypothetical protein
MDAGIEARGVLELEPIPISPRGAQDYRPASPRFDDPPLS